MTDDKRLGPPPVEPMSDIAWSRVERGLWSRLEGTQTVTTVMPSAPASRRWMLVVAPIIAAAATVALVLALRGGGEVTQRIEPSRVVAGDAPSSISFGDAHIELDATSAVVMSQEDGSPTVLLEHGGARFTVAPRNERPAFVVRAGDATVRVIGTQFKVARYEEHLTVAVERGLVDVHFRGASVKIGAGQRWSSDAPSNIITAAAEPPKPGEPAEDADDTEIEITPAPATPGHKPPSHKPHKPKKPHVATAEPPKPAEPTPCGADCVEFNRLSTIEPTQPGQAIDGYLALSKRSAAYAENALYAAARLAFDRKDHRAKGLLEIYLQRFPGGTHAADANGLLTRLKGG